MTRTRSLLHAGAVFTAVLAVGFVLTTGGAWLALGASAAVASVLATLGTFATSWIALILALTTFDARRKS